MLSFPRYSAPLAYRAFTFSAIALLMLLASEWPHSARCQQVKAKTVRVPVEEGALVSKADLLVPAPADENHILPRPVIANEEGDLTSKPNNTQILVVHYRASTRLGPFDDRLLLATPKGGKYQVLKILDSNAAEVNGELSSLDDFDVRFKSLRGFRFLHIRDRQGKVVDNLIYTAVNGGPLIEIRVPDLNPTLLRKEEELRNNHCELGGDKFRCEAGIYLSKDSECCPSDGTYHSELELIGGFKFDEKKRTYTPDFQFVLAKEWRTNEH